MIVVTAGTAEYRSIIEEQSRRCAQLGYGHKVYDLGGLASGKYFAPDESDFVLGVGVKPVTFKPRVLLDFLESYGPLMGETLCWLDADCLPMRGFVPPPGSWNVAVTMRSAREIGASGIFATDFLNSGAAWVRNPEFLYSWKKACDKYGSDQSAMNHLVLPKFEPDYCRSLFGKIIESPCGMNSLILDAGEWNNWNWMLPIPAETRILHFKGKAIGSAQKFIDQSWQRRN